MTYLASKLLNTQKFRDSKKQFLLLTKHFSDVV